MSRGLGDVYKRQDKGQTQMVKRIDKALDELKADGTYDKLIQKWFGNVKGFDAKGAGER